MSNEPLGRGGVRWQVRLDQYCVFFRKPTIQQYRTKMQELMKQKDNEIARLQQRLDIANTRYESLLVRFEELKKKVLKK